jgi:hypothetical protein
MKILVARPFRYRRWSPVRRELVWVLTRGSPLRPAVMFGLGGILTENLRTTVFRIAPLTHADAREMMGKSGKQDPGILQGRGRAIWTS